METQALIHMAIPHRELRTLHIYRILTPRSLDELFDVGVAAHSAADVRRDRPIHSLPQRGDAVDAHERRDRNLGPPPRIVPHKGREPRVLPLVEGEYLNERRSTVERLIRRNRARHLSRARVAELGGFGELMERREEVGS